jgi:hypothetical protein
MHSAQQKLQKLKGQEDINKIRAELVKPLKGDIKKKLKNAPILRVFYGIINLKNSEELYKIIGI